MMVATYIAAGDERGAAHRRGVRLERRAGAGQYPGRCLGDAAALHRQAADHPVGGRTRTPAAPAAGPLPVPAGSTLIVRSSGGTLDVVAGGGVTEAAPTEQAPKGTNERHFTIAGDGTAQVRAPSGQPQWKFSATPDRAPTIALAKDPERQARGSLQMSYKIEDDYGVTEAQARFAARPRRRPRTRQGRRGSRGRCSTRRSFRWCCRMRGPATASARPSRISARIPMPAPTSR